MHPAFVIAVTGAVFLVATAVEAQTSPTPTSGVLATGIPPNAIDRATAITDQRRANAAQSSAVDRLDAERAARAANARNGPVAGSTFSDGVAGLGTRPDVTSPPTATAPPQ